MNAIIACVTSAAYIIQAVVHCIVKHNVGDVMIIVNDKIPAICNSEY